MKKLGSFVAVFVVILATISAQELPDASITEFSIETKGRFDIGPLLFSGRDHFLVHDGQYYSLDADVLGMSQSFGVNTVTTSTSYFPYLSNKGPGERLSYDSLSIWNWRRTALESSAEEVAQREAFYSSSLYASIENTGRTGIFKEIGSLEFSKSLRNVSSATLYFMHRMLFWSGTIAAAAGAVQFAVEGELGLGTLLSASLLVGTDLVVVAVNNIRVASANRKLDRLYQALVRAE